MTNSRRLLQSLPLLVVMTACGKSHDQHPGVPPTSVPIPGPSPTAEPQPTPTQEPVPVQALLNFNEVFQPVDRVVCKDQSDAKGIGGTFSHLSYAFDACEFRLQAKDSGRIKSISSMKIMNEDSKWSVAFKASQGTDLSFEVSLKRDTSVAQFSDYVPKEDLQIELQVADEAGKTFPVSLRVTKPTEDDFYTVKVSMRMEHKRYVYPNNEDQGREVIVQGRKTADGRSVLRYAIFPSRDAENFVYHRVEPILIDTRINIADGFGLGTLRNQYTVSTQPENELAALIYEGYRSLNGYSAILAGSKALAGAVDLSSEALTMRMSGYKKAITEESATVHLAYVSAFGASHTVQSNLLLTSRQLSDDLILNEMSPGSYSLKNRAPYSLFPLRGDFRLKCSQNSKSLETKGPYFPTRTSLEWQNPGPGSEILSFSAAEIIKGLEPCADGWKLENIGISEVVPEGYPERETSVIVFPH